MRRPDFLLPAAAFVGLLLFFGLLIRLLLLRYERGDVYPAYSTLRADPLGARAYYEALGSINEYAVARGFTSLHRELEGKPDTLLYLGLDERDLVSFSKEETAELDAYVKNGGRVVITFKPEEPGATHSDDAERAADKKRKVEGPPSKQEVPKPDKKPPVQASETQPDEDDPKTKTEEEKYEREEFRLKQKVKSMLNPGQQSDEPPEKYQISLAALWGFGWSRHPANEPNGRENSAAHAPADEDKPEVQAWHSAEGNLETSVPWKSALYFVRLEPEWRRLYDAKWKPVLIRRSWGKGEIIVATDSYPVSNEALRNDRRPRLLALLAGPPGSLLFDETHLGTQKQEGVMFLAEKFRLEGYLYGMLGVVVLFLWRNSVSLVPPRYSGGQALLGGAISGKDSRSGLVNLLRRNIAAADILKTSFAEWKRNVTPGRRHLQDKVSEMASIVSAAETARGDQMIQSYHQLREINTPRRPQGNYATKS